MALPGWRNEANRDADGPGGDWVIDGTKHFISHADIADYVILFAEDDIPTVSDGYGVSTIHPGFQILGLRGWDDFILRDKFGGVFTVPTLPCDLRHLAPYTPPSAAELKADDRVLGKIKWYIKPILFGGDPTSGDNVAWVTHEEHVQLVRWWNDRYRSTSGNAG
jgi:hypothetical protein